MSVTLVRVVDIRQLWAISVMIRHAVLLQFATSFPKSRKLWDVQFLFNPKMLW